MRSVRQRGVIQVRKFMPSDLDGFIGREGDGPKEIAIGLEVYHRYPRFAFSLFDGPSPIVCVGMLLVAEGIGHPWVIIREGAELKALRFHRMIKRLLQFAIAEMKLKMVETYIKETSERNRRWAEALGFKLVCPIREHWFKGERYVRYELEALCHS